MSIADLGEFGFITAITSNLRRGERTLVGVGDDAAVLAAPDARVVATMDLLIEGRHFRRDWSGPADIGGKAAARNLADVAAMGADPVALLVGLAAPGDLEVSWAQELVSGIQAECGRAGATVVGGDVSKAEKIFLAITALGDLAGREPVTRHGAHPGDVVAVAGVLGHSAAGHALMAAGLTAPEPLIAAHRHPRPPYEAGPQAARLGVTSMIDVSDGLVQDLGHVAHASGVRICIETGRLRPDPGLAAAARALGRSGPLEWILTGGEDHALAVTFSPAVPFPAGWQVIGQVREGDGIYVDGQRFQGPGGWDHFAR